MDNAVFDSISGLIAKTGEPAIFTNVYFVGTTIGSPTDVNGYFSITKIPPGDYTLQSTSLGFDTVSIKVTVRKGDIITKKLYLNTSSVKLKEFTVSAEKKEAQTQVKMSVTKITPKDIQKIPSVGGEADLAQYLQVLPGVIFTGDQGGQMYVRGGSPVQNKVLLDGMIVYNPFHSISIHRQLKVFFRSNQSQSRISEVVGFSETEKRFLAAF